LFLAWIARNSLKRKWYFSWEMQATKEALENELNTIIPVHCHVKQEIAFKNNYI
jgi:hypothetical protein